MIRCYEHENSLFFEQFSLIRAENFPVPLRREFGCKSLNLRARADVDLPLDRQDPRNSLLFSLLAGNLPQRPVRSGLRPQPSTKLLIILIKKPSSTINFRPEKRRFRAVACSAGWRRDGIRRGVRVGGGENLSGGVWWLNFSARAEHLRASRTKNVGERQAAPTSPIFYLLSAKSE